MHPHTLPAPVLDGGGCADWFGRHENVRFQENPGQEGANCVGISQGTTCGLKEDCLDMLMSAWCVGGTPLNSPGLALQPVPTYFS